MIGWGMHSSCWNGVLHLKMLHMCNNFTWKPYPALWLVLLQSDLHWVPCCNGDTWLANTVDKKKRQLVWVSVYITPAFAKEPLNNGCVAHVKTHWHQYFGCYKFAICCNAISCKYKSIDTMWVGVMVPRKYISKL